MEDAMKIRNVIMVLMLGCATAHDQALAEAPAKVYSSHPDGKGDPAGITCRHPQALQGMRLLGPEVCRTNADWAQFAKDGMDVSPDGRTLVPSEKSRSLNPAACGPAAPSAGASSGMNAMAGARLC
jgi:hypothetical protein